jgi:hypothetical protein
MATGKPDPVLAHPPGECCIAGTIHQGEPRGSRTTIAGVDTYVSKPREGKWNGHVVLYFPDIHAFFTNGFLVMDGFAAAGFLTLGVDYFRGVSLHFGSHATARLTDSNRTRLQTTEKIPTTRP